MIDSKKPRGFTIVELLIVIVILAILATITVVTFSGVRERAINSQVAAAVQQWEKQLALYKVFAGNQLSAPGGFGFTPVCLGKIDTNDRQNTDCYLFATNDLGNSASTGGIGNSSTGGSTTREEQSGRYAAFLAEAGIVVPPAAMFERIRITDNRGAWYYRGVQLVSDPDRTKYFLLYPLFGRACIGNDKEATPAFGDTTADAYGFAKNGNIMCRRDLS